MNSIWKGSISFGLVNVPVKLYSAIDQQATRMRMLHKKDLSPIRYKKWCEGCKEEVQMSDIVKGVKVGDDEYVVVTKEELASIKPEKSQSIAIVEFIDSHQLNPIFFDAHYYIGPDKAKDKAYFLFKEILEQTARVAIGTFVMREREYVCAIESYGPGMLLTTLNYKYEIRDIKDIGELRERPKLTKQEIDLGKELINKIYVDAFEIEKFEDTYEESLQQLVKKKGKGHHIKVQKKEKPATKEKDLVAALKASLQ